MSKKENKPTHIDDFIDFGIRKSKEKHEDYARWILNHFRLSANLKMTFNQFMKEHKLFCDYKGKRYRVTGASRLGDIWLISNFIQEAGYEKRVSVDGCSNWYKWADEKC